MNYEVSHVYMDGELGEEQVKGIEIFHSIKRDIDKAVLMIDDYSFKHGGKKENLTIEEIMSFYKNNNVSLDNTILESSLINIGEKIISFLPIKRERFRRDDKIVLFSTIGKKKIKVKEIYSDGREMYSCVLLSSSWHLKRSGMVDKNLDFIKQSIDITSILPYEYESVESNVLNIISFFECKNNYIFY